MSNKEFQILKGNSLLRRRMIREISVLFCTLCLCLCWNPVGAESLRFARVVTIIDGDSIVVKSSGERIEVRLWGIDTPEYHQPGSRVAKRFTAAFLLHKQVDLEIKDMDDYGRTVAMVLLQDGRNASEELVRAGYAWVHIYYCKEPVCIKWDRLQREAQQKKSGLWRDNAPVAPWVWKRKH